MTLNDLQTQLKAHKLDAYIITRNNMFLGQDILDSENKIQELTNFSGSAGSLIVFADKAILFVDGRYELQASMEVDSNLVNVVCTNGESLGTWMQNNLNEPLKIAFNPWCHSISEVDYWNRVLKKHVFVEDTNKLLGNRLCTEEVDIFEHNIEFSGVSMEEKISYLTEFMQKNRLDGYFMADCDAVSWLMNLRSNCLSDTPVIRAFALVDKLGEVSLFTQDFNQIEIELSRYQKQTIGVAYNHTPKQLQTLMKNHKIWLENIGNPVQNWKAVKNPIEIAGIKKAHHRDGLSVVKFLHWLDNNWQGQDELSIVKKLRSFRQNNENFFSNSFETIAGFGSNGAIVHYRATPQTNKKLEKDSIILIDSGAQYYDGTTDITRTIAIGKPSSEIVDSFTHVLKAHIALANAYFPNGTSGQSLDCLARSQLWQFGKNYNHGTGHGVGCFLNVHEGPHSISSRNSASPLQENMITSIEPGYYKEGQYGIRIENLVKISAVDNTAFEIPMLKFEPLTLAPLDKRLINKYLLNKKETAWLNDYHHHVYQELNADLDADTKLWLKEACSPL